MDARAHERRRQGLHGLVKPPIAASVAFSLLCGIAGGLTRAGTVAGDAAWLGNAAVFHAAVMMAGFFGTVIGIERAVASKRGIAFLAPVASSAGTIALIMGAQAVATALLLTASLVFVSVNVVLAMHERAAHTVLLAAAAGSLLIGNAVFASGAGSPIAWWFGFLVVTIAAERLEMTRLMPPRLAAKAMLMAVMIALASGAAFSPALFGAALLALALWLATFDIARRTIRAAGLPRYMAVCLLTGYAWLAIGGIGWMTGWRDAALHAVGLGFVMSMVMAHAPVILPAVAGIAVRFTPAFYLPLAVLHASLGWRLGGNLAAGALANALGIGLFVIAVAMSARQRKSRP